jgi:hypothetical protein
MQGQAKFETLASYEALIQRSGLIDAPSSINQINATLGCIQC